MTHFAHIAPILIVLLIPLNIHSEYMDWVLQPNTQSISASLPVINNTKSTTIADKMSIVLMMMRHESIYSMIQDIAIA